MCRESGLWVCLQRVLYVTCSPSFSRGTHHIVLEGDLDALSGGRPERLLGLVVEVVAVQPVRGGMGRLSAGQARVEGRGRAGRRLEGAGAHDRNDGT